MLSAENFILKTENFVLTMAKVIIDGREIELPDGQKLNAIQAAARAGIEIPHYCFHAGLTVVGSCRMCLIETGTRDAKTGEIKMQPKLVPGCTTPATDGTVISTTGEKVTQARAIVEEDLLLRHPVDCPICDKAGECSLQDYYFKYGQKTRRTDIQPFTSRRRDLGDVTLFVDRCVMCSRCVRFCHEVSGTHELMVTNRGAHEEIDVVPGFPLDNDLSGNVVDLCPVGALGDKDFLYQQRVWFMRRHAGVCTGCSVGCSIWVEENQDHVYRIKPRENAEVNKWWICNHGRYGYHHVHDERRLQSPRGRTAGQTGLQTTELDWDTLPSQLLSKMKGAGHLAAVLSPMLTVEEAYLLAKLLRSIDPKADFALGPVPVVGEDQHFPGFTIAAEKAPNRRGVEEVIAFFMKKVTRFEDFVAQLGGNAYKGVWVSGGYKLPEGSNVSGTLRVPSPSGTQSVPNTLGTWIDAATAKKFEQIPLLIVQDLFPSPLSEKAHYELPSAAFAERDGSYVNRTDRIQSARMAIRPPWGVRAEGSLFWQMLGRKGLYQARAVLDDLSREIPYFAAAKGPIPPTGLDLKVNMLAGGKSSASHGASEGKRDGKPVSV